MTLPVRATVRLIRAVTTGTLEFRARANVPHWSRTRCRQFAAQCCAQLVYARAYPTASRLGPSGNLVRSSIGDRCRASRRAATVLELCRPERMGSGGSLTALAGLVHDIELLRGDHADKGSGRGPGEDGRLRIGAPHVGLEPPRH